MDRFLRPTLLPDGTLSVPRGWGDAGLAADLDDIETAPVRLPDGRTGTRDMVPDLADELGDE